jgi:hypothetical protein
MSIYDDISPNEKGSELYELQIPEYSKMGWKLLPCHGITNGKCNCGDLHHNSSDAGKHPLLYDWNNNSTGNLESINKWFGSNTGHNVAVNCRASGLVVIDIDPRNGGDESFLQLENWLDGEIPETLTVLTGEYFIGGVRTRGRHLYFKAQEGDQFYKDFSKQGFKGIDIKFNGYVLLPPSKHVSGVDYIWDENLNPFKTSISSLSSKMRDLMVKKTHLPNNSIGLNKFNFELEKNIQATDSSRRELDKQVIRISLGTAEGQRNVTLNESAFIMGQYIGGGQISVTEVVGALTKAARIAYKGQNAESEIASVLRLSGGALSAGANTPIYNVEFQSVETPDVEHGTDDEFLKRLNLVNWKEVWEDTSEEVWFVDGIICAERGHTIYSDPGVGKSLLVREFSACLATGKSVLGLSAKKPIRVLYIDHENIPKTDIRRSLVDMGFTWEELEMNFKLMSFPDFTPFDLPKGGQELKRAIEIINPELVVIDTLSRAIKGKENDNDTWIDFYNYTGKILKSMGIAYIRIDHTGKNSDAGPRGGSAKMGDVDLVWHLKEVVTDKKYRLINEKHRVPLTQLEYKISRELLPLRHQLSGALDWKLYAIRSAKYEKIYREISNFMDTNPTHRNGLNSLFSALKDECKDLGVSRREFDRARKDYFDIQDEIAEFEE